MRLTLLTQYTTVLCVKFNKITMKFKMRGLVLILSVFLTLISGSLAFAGGSTFGVTETNVRDKYLVAGESDQFLMSFELDRAGTFEFSKLDITCVPSRGLTNLKLMQGESEIYSTEFGETSYDGSQFAHFGFSGSNYTVPVGENVEYSLFVDVEEGTGDFITACAIYDMVLFNPKIETLYDSGYQNVEMSGIDKLIYVDDLTSDNRMENFHVFDAGIIPKDLGLNTKDNLLMEFAVNASEDIELQDLFIYCENASIIQRARLVVDEVVNDDAVMHMDWYSTSRAEHSRNKLIAFTDLGAITGLGAGRSFKLYGDTYDYFSLMPGTVTDCSVLDIMAADVSETNMDEAPYYPTYTDSFELFTDVKGGMAYAYAIGLMAKIGVIEGYSDGTFRPDATVNRAEFLKIVLLASGYGDRIPEVSSSSGFSDTDANAWYAKYVAFSKAKGIIEGYPDGTFKPDQQISRAEGLKIIIGEFFHGNEKSIGTYSEDDKMAITGCYDRFMKDVESGSWYENFAFYAHGRCIIPSQMVDDHYLYPAKALTRGETIEMMLRARAARDHSNDYNVGLSPKTKYNTCFHEAEIMNTDKAGVCCPGLYPKEEAGAFVCT